MDPLLQVEDLWVTFSVQGEKLHAVRGICFEVGRGEAVGIVGESGCGKSAAVQAIHRLTRGTVSGKILLEGKEITSPGRDVGMVFQDPMTSLNPTMKIGEQISEGLVYHKLATRDEAKARALELLHLVGIPDPELRIHQYPHQLSGGMRQRVLIAIAVACNPKLLIADEPTTALDVIVQAQILDLIRRMREHFSMSLLLISHDFNIVAAVCERILVMYAGKIVESGTVDEVLNQPRHPYTQMLLASLPRLDKSKSEPLIAIPGSPPHLLALPKGCPFKERCPFAAIKCNEEPPGPIACWRTQ